MNKGQYFFATSLVFLAVTIVHTLRLINHWEAQINGFLVPMWVSWVTVIVAGLLAFEGFREANQ